MIKRLIGPLYENHTVPWVVLHDTTRRKSVSCGPTQLSKAPPSLRTGIKSKSWALTVLVGPLMPLPAPDIL